MNAKKELRKRISRNEIEDVLRELVFLGQRYDNSDLEDDAIFQSGRWKEINARRKTNTVSWENEQLERANIRLATIQIVNDLPNNWIVKKTRKIVRSNSTDYSITSRILISATFVILVVTIWFVKVGHNNFNKERVSKKDTEISIDSIPLKMSTSGANSPAILTEEGNVNINYGEQKSIDTTANN